MKSSTISNILNNMNNLQMQLRVKADVVWEGERGACDKMMVFVLTNALLL